MTKTALFLLLLTVLTIFAVTLLDPIAQDTAYHLFADRRSWWQIPNTLDVLSNVPFVVVGLMGLWQLAFYRQHRLFWPFLAIFIGVFFTGFGSAYYHWLPSNATLVWDRLPMTVAFMGLLTMLLADRIDMRWRYALLPLLLAGLASVGYWHSSEIRGAGDLRPYLLVQFLPMLLIPLIVWLYPSPRRDMGCYIGLVSCYLAAKLLEYFDRPIFELTAVISGHSLKHLAAALAALLLYFLWQQHTQDENND